jgi:hypothetical protein
VKIFAFEPDFSCQAEFGGEFGSGELRGFHKVILEKFTGYIIPPRILTYFLLTNFYSQNILVMFKINLLYLYDYHLSRM